MINENEIYLWEEGGNILGFCSINIKGIKEDFGGGFAIENKEGKKEKNGLARNRAIRQVKIQFANVIDALKIYGKEVLDSYGNIDPKKFTEKEKALQRMRVKNDIVAFVKEDMITKLKDLKVNMITTEESIKLGIGNK